MTPSELFDLLDGNGIRYLRVDHPPVYTCEEADRVVPPLPGAATKNLFLRDGKGRRHFLVSVPAGKMINLKSLAGLLDAPGLGFASADRLAKFLALEPGAVTLLGALNDHSGSVQVVVDESLWREERILCHPLVNTSTISLAKLDLEKVLLMSEHTPRVVAVP